MAGCEGLERYCKAYQEALEKAISILSLQRGAWLNEVEAYFILVRHEDELGFPVTYDFVVEALERLRTLRGVGKEEARAFSTT